MLSGEYHTLMTQIERKCHSDFVNYMRMLQTMSYDLLQRIKTKIQRVNVKDGKNTWTEVGHYPHV